MTEAEKILNMIENVNPKHISVLREIDARVWCFLQNVDFLEIKDDYFLFWHNEYTKLRKYLHDTVPYTRSRDILKSIRPEGWYLNRIYTLSNLYVCQMCKEISTDGIKMTISEIGGNPLQTEELAELYAIIQAIRWERKNDKR